LGCDGSRNVVRRTHGLDDPDAARSSRGERRDWRAPTPLDVAEPDVTSDQVGPARDLLALSTHPVIFATKAPAQDQSAAQTGSVADAGRIARLMEQISQIDPELVPIDDLIPLRRLYRLRQTAQQIGVGVRLLVWIAASRRIKPLGYGGFLGP
jgi:hypothetical protein